MEKRLNEESEMELISIELINSRKQKVEGLMLHYGAELGKDFGRLGCSTTMIFASEGRISDDMVVNPQMRKQIVTFVKEFLENYLEELSEELKKPLKADK